MVAAGSGSRFGGPKHLANFGGQRVIDHSLDAAMNVSDGVVVVVAADGVSTFAESIAARPDVVVVAGGDSRSASVRCGLAAVPADAEVILVHDGARPLAGKALFTQVVAAVRGGAAAVVPGIAVVDTIRRRSGGVVDRDELVAVQTPQGFDAATLRAAHDSGNEATDDAGLVEGHGHAVVVVEGVRENIKITNPEDLAIALTLRDQVDG